MLPELTADLGISHAVGGLLITLPVLLMAAVAIPAAGFGNRFGSRRVMALSLVLLAAAGTLRPLGGDELWLLAWTIPIGIGIGVIGVILPIFVKQHASAMPARATGLYVTAMLVGSALGGILAAPLAEWGGSWRVPLLVFGIAGIVPVVGWLALTKPDHREAADRPERSPLPWREPVAWLLVAAFALQAFLFYGIVAWLAPVMVESGRSTIEAGTVVGVLLIAGIPGTLLVSWLGDQASFTANRSGPDVRCDAHRHRGLRVAARLRAAVVRDRRPRPRRDLRTGHDPAARRGAPAQPRSAATPR